MKGKRSRSAVTWASDNSWGGDWGGNHASATKGAGQLLVHETHAPKKISHIQFGLLTAEVRQAPLDEKGCCPCECFPRSSFEFNLQHWRIGARNVDVPHVLRRKGDMQSFTSQ